MGRPRPAGAVAPLEPTRLVPTATTGLASPAPTGWPPTRHRSRAAASLAGGYVGVVVGYPCLWPATALLARLSLVGSCVASAAVAVACVATTALVAALLVK